MSNIPIFDFASVKNSSPCENLKFVQNVDEACRDIGFFVIKNPPIDLKLINKTYALAREFFSLPDSIKMNYYIGHQANHRGYVPPGEEQYGQVQGDPDAETSVPRELKEGFEIGTYTHCDDLDFLSGVRFLGPNIWPKEIPNFQLTVEKYFLQTLKFGETLIRVFAKALKVDENIFFNMMRKPISNLRLLHYQAREARIGQKYIGIGPHTDSECFTILSTRGTGLQIFNRDESWVDVPSVEGGVIVNIGDTLEVWTNGAYVSPQHRVLSSTKQRWSLPLFVSPDYFQKIEPLPQLISIGSYPRYAPFIAGPHKLSEYAKGFRYLKNLARKGLINLETQPNEVSKFTKLNI